MALHPGPSAGGTDLLRELLQWPGFPGPQPHLFIVEGGGDGGPQPAVPSKDRPTSAWLAFLSEWAEEPVSLFQRGRGLREKREEPGLRVRGADARAGPKGHVPGPEDILEWS